jgi:hypothetical protein
LLAKPLNEMDLFLDALNAVLLKKKLFSVVKIQNGGCVQDGVKSFFIFHPIHNPTRFFLLKKIIDSCIILVR